ncbi:MAG: site-2 protease family protein [Planctomycetaceae bacterium]
MELPSPLEENQSADRGVTVEVISPNDPRYRPAAIPQPQSYEHPPRYILAAFLYVATCLSTFLAGALHSGQILVEEGKEWEPFVNDWGLLWEWGLSYSLAVMGILTFHELGHYLQAKRYGVPASLPYFIPFPMLNPFGTMGAVIVQRTGWRDRKILFDIAVTGPLAGLVLTIPILYFGLKSSEYMPIQPELMGEPGFIRYGDPLIVKLMASWILGEQPANSDILLTPLLFAAWVGLFVTALNLIPLGQLDGGHILYALIGRKAHRLALALVLFAVIWMVYNHRYEYTLMLILVAWMGVKHPPTGDDRAHLGPFRVIIGWLTLAFLILGFTPTPLIM